MAAAVCKISARFMHVDLAHCDWRLANGQWPENCEMHEMQMKALANLILALALAFGSVVSAKAQDQLQYIDLKSDQFTKADMTRSEIEAAIVAAGEGTVDLFGKRLNGLDLSGLDLRKTKLQSTYINGTNFTGANLDGVALDRAWALKANFTNATFKGASLIEAQMMDAKFDGADFSGARIVANMSRASFVNARFDGANLARHGRMQAHRAIFSSAKLDGSSFKGARAPRAVFEFAVLRDVDFAGADLSGCAFAGADLTGANVTGADFANADVESAKLVSLRGGDAVVNLDKARNLEHAQRD